MFMVPNASGRQEKLVEATIITETAITLDK